MKKILFYLSFILSVGLVMSSCTKDDEKNQFADLTQIEGGAIMLGTDFNGFFNKVDPTQEISFTVGTKGENVSSVVLTKSYNGGAAIDVATLNSFPSTLSYNLNEILDGFGVDVDGTVPGDVITFGFRDLSATSGTYPSGLTIPFSVTCPSTLEGMYDVTTTYGAHDFLATYPSNTTTAEIVEEGAGLYSVADFSGGLYASDGPYGTAYGTTGLAVTFSDVCNDISWTGQSDPWGPCIPDPNGVNSVDPVTGVITISWLCEGYGENGVSVYTPQ